MERIAGGYRRIDRLLLTGTSTEVTMLFDKQIAVPDVLTVNICNFSSILIIFYSNVCILYSTKMFWPVIEYYFSDCCWFSAFVWCKYYSYILHKPCYDQYFILWYSPHSNGLLIQWICLDVPNVTMTLLSHTTWPFRFRSR